MRRTLEATVVQVSIASPDPPRMMQREEFPLGESGKLGPCFVLRPPSWAEGAPQGADDV